MWLIMIKAVFVPCKLACLVLNGTKISENKGLG